MLVLHGLIEADGAVEALPLQAADCAHALSHSHAATVSTDDVALCLREAEVCLPNEGLLILLALFLRPELIEVRHHVAHCLLIHRYALLQDVEGSG